MKTITNLAALLAAGLTLAAGIGHVSQAYAQPPAVQTVAIHYGDLDIGSEAGRRALDQRIRQAVASACGDPSPSDLRGQNLAAACRSDLMASLTQQRDMAFSAGASARPTLVARR